MAVDSVFQIPGNHAPHLARLRPVDQVDLSSSPVVGANGCGELTSGLELASVWLAIESVTVRHGEVAGDGSGGEGMRKRLQQVAALKAQSLRASADIPDRLRPSKRTIVESARSHRHSRASIDSVDAESFQEHGKSRRGRRIRAFDKG